jgi:hypothetical protein
MEGGGEVEGDDGEGRWRRRIEGEGGWWDKERKKERNKREGTRFCDFGRANKSATRRK